jgi:excisionase family DNA binding protein
MPLLDELNTFVAASGCFRLPGAALEVRQAGVSCRGPARPPRSGGQPVRIDGSRPSAEGPDEKRRWEWEVSDMQSMRVEAELLRAEEVARVLGVGRSKVFEMFRTGDLPVLRMGRCVRVPRSALAAWIEAQTESSAVPGWRVPGRRLG